MAQTTPPATHLKRFMAASMHVAGFTSRLVDDDKCNARTIAGKEACSPVEAVRRTSGAHFFHYFRSKWHKTGTRKHRLAGRSTHHGQALYACCSSARSVTGTALISIPKATRSSCAASTVFPEALGS